MCIRDRNVTCPDDYQATNLAGKDAVFATTLNYINEDVTPDLTDDWVSSNLAESMGCLLYTSPYIRKGTEPYGNRKNRAHQCAGS